MLYNNILETIGNTPIVKINRFPLDPSKRKNVYAKIEFFNPGKSVKDRIAFNIIHQAELEGDIQKGAIVIESSSGNTGIGLSIVCRVKGYKNIVVIDKNCPKEKVKLLKALGAKIVVIESNLSHNADLTEKRIEFVKKAKEIISNIFIPNQYENKNAPLAHYNTTGKEIIEFIEQTGIHFDAIFISVGTGGTITGVSKRIKEYDPKIKIIGVEPVGSILFGGEKGGYYQQGPGNYFIPKNLKYDYIDQGIKVSDQDAFNMCRKVAQEEGLLLGGSSGGLLFKTVELSQNYPGNVLCILPDGGEKYLDSVYNDDWLQERNIKIYEENKNPIQHLCIDGIQDYGELVKQVREVFE